MRAEGRSQERRRRRAPKARTRDVAVLFAALGDGTRLSLVTKLGEGPSSATRLSDDAEVSRQAIVKHLRVLEGAGLVASERQGREVLYRLDPGPFDEAKAFLDAVSARWDAAIERLRTLVER